MCFTRIKYYEKNNLILNKSLFKELAAFIRSEGDPASAYKVMSRSFHISAVYRMKSDELRTEP